MSRWRCTRAPLWALALGFSSSCDCGSERHTAPSVSVAPAAAPAPPAVVPGPLPVASDAAAPPATPERAANRAPRVLPSRVGGRDATSPEGSVIGRFIVDSLVDVAAAGPATATERGVAMVNRDNALWLAPLGPLPRSSSKPRATPLRSLPESSGPFPLAKGPAVRGSHAYWVSRGRLLRGSLASAGPDTAPEVLREDARVGTRVAVPRGAPKDVAVLPQLVAYVAHSATPDAPLTPQLWIEGQPEPMPLSDDTISSHSVSLIASPQALTAIFLEARTGMSSLHLRRITLSEKNQLSLGEDRIAWVGGPSRSSTEFLAPSTDGASALGLMTLERDITHFGLVTLHLPLPDGRRPPEPVSQTAGVPEPDWLLYENGIEPAPFAEVELCGRRVVALARPSSATPDAPQELVLLELERLDAPGIVLARSRAFFDVSLCALGSGALLTYVADQRTWGRSLRCAPG